MTSQEAKEYFRLYYQKNKASILSKRKIHYTKNKERILRYDREYYENNREKVLSREKEASLTKRGVVTTIYSSQKTSSKRRGHPQPKYTKKQFSKWVLSQELFHKIFDEWKASGHTPDLKPSVDRLNDYKGYSFDNIRIITWGENRKRSHSDVVNGINNKHSKSVARLDLDGNIIEIYYSIAEASRSTNINKSGIARACTGVLSTSGGYKWEYSKYFNLQ